MLLDRRGSTATRLRSRAAEFCKCRCLQIACCSMLTSVSRTVSPAAGSGLTRYFTITSGTTINPGNTRTVTFYAGRRSSTTGLNTASIDVQIKGSSGPSVSSTQASVCSGASCTLPGSNGSVWQKYTFSFTSNARYQLALQMTVYFGNGAVATDGSDDVLIDYISVV